MCAFIYMSRVLSVAFHNDISHVLIKYFIYENLTYLDLKLFLSKYEFLFITEVNEFWHNELFF